MARLVSATRDHCTVITRLGLRNHRDHDTVITRLVLRYQGPLRCHDQLVQSYQGPLHFHDQVSLALPGTTELT